jgi:hypothetical protein
LALLQQPPPQHCLAREHVLPAGSPVPLQPGGAAARGRAVTHMQRGGEECKHWCSGAPAVNARCLWRPAHTGAWHVCCQAAIGAQAQQAADHNNATRMLAALTHAVARDVQASAARVDVFVDALCTHLAGGRAACARARQTGRQGHSSGSAQGGGMVQACASRPGVCGCCSRGDGLRRGTLPRHARQHDIMRLCAVLSTTRSQSLQQHMPPPTQALPLTDFVAALAKVAHAVVAADVLVLLARRLQLGAACSSTAAAPSTRARGSVRWRQRQRAPGARASSQRVPRLGRRHGSGTAGLLPGQPTAHMKVLCQAW